ncbi:hypothetical protein TNCV_3554801 [Trichonephila clavipes]|nr:hypothetical protein TNCV_3554801 [Trichonephila clavipes]
MVAEMDVWRRHVVFWGKNISWKYGFNLKREMDAQAGKMEDVFSGRVISRMRAVGGNVSGAGCIRGTMHVKYFEAETSSRWYDVEVRREAARSGAILVP